MSYEGHEQLICKNGHYFCVDAYNFSSPKEEKCPFCKSSMQWFRSVDETNGEIEDAPETQQAEVEEVGFNDIERRDHYNNKYFEKEMLYKPKDPSLWREVK